MSEITFDKDGYATSTEEVQLYGYEPLGKYLVYSGSFVEYVFIGTTLPDNKTLIAPPANIDAGYKAFWNGTGWSVRECHIGERWYDIVTGEQLIITELGSVPSGYTKSVYLGSDYEYVEGSDSWELKQSVIDEGEINSAKSIKLSLINRLIELCSTCNVMNSAGINPTYYNEMLLKYQANLVVAYNIDVKDPSTIEWPEIEELTLC